MSIARNRLAELIKQERARQSSGRQPKEGKLIFRDAVETYLERIEGNPDLKPATKKYRRQCVQAILKTWPEIADRDVRKLSRGESQEWALRLRQHGTKFRPPGAKKVRQGISATYYNNTVATLSQILDQAIESGILLVNPIQQFKRARVIAKELTLPSRVQFSKFVQLIETSGAAQAKDCANLVRFLAFSGCRIGEAQTVRWQDIDWDKGELVVRGDALNPRPLTIWRRLNWVEFVMNSPLTRNGRCPRALFFMLDGFTCRRACSTAY